VEKQVEEPFMSDGNPAPCFARQPGRIMEYTPAGKRIRVIFDGVIIGDTQAAIALQEANYPVGYYIPRLDVRMDLMRRTDHSSHCPFKGDASYWTLETSGKSAKNAAWSYESPFDEADVIKGYLSFYGSKVVEIEVI
jgi:uncharacterized protein (DUF427 family)